MKIKLASKGITAIRNSVCHSGSAHSTPILNGCSRVSPSIAQRLQKCTTREEFNLLLKEYRQARMSGTCLDDMQVLFQAKAQEIRKVLNSNAKSYFLTKMSTEPKFIFNNSLLKTQFNNFISNTNGDYDLLYRIVNDANLGFKGNKSAFMRIISSTNSNTSKYLNYYLNGTLIKKLDANKLVDLNADEIAHVMQFNRNNKNLNELLGDPKNLTDFLKRSEQIIQHAEKYRPELASALKHNMVYRDGTFFNSTVNKNLLDDMEALIHGKSYYPKFDKSASLSQIMAETKLGDAIAIDGKMFLNNGKNLERLQFDEKMYNKLFPPIDRFDIRQSKKTGDCFLISPLENLMNSQKGRCNIYRMFSQDASGNLFVKTAGNKVPVRVNNLTPNAQELAGNNGLALLEREFNAYNNSSSSIAAYTGILGDNCQIVHHAFDSRSIAKIIGNDFNKYLNKDDYLIRVAFTKANPQYNMLTGHAYSLKAYDKANKTFTITNPHRAGIDICVPEGDILPYLAKLDIVKI